MSEISEIKKELEDLETVQFVTGTLLEVSTEKMKGLREEFESNKVFYQDIGELYSVVKLSAAKEDISVTRASKTLKSEITVAITSNERFYGSINREVMQEALAFIQKQDTDFLVIGETGKNYLSAYNKGDYPSTVFETDDPTERETRSLLKSVGQYKRVYLFHPKFVNLVTHEVGMLDITYTPQPENIESYDIGHIFEPELSKILQFFEHRVRHILFTRVLLESELARTAIRMVSMNTAETKASEGVKEKHTELRKAKSLISDLRLLESLAGMPIWKK